MGIDRGRVRVAATIGNARAVVGQEDNADDGLLVICVEQVSARLLMSGRRTDGWSGNRLILFLGLIPHQY